MISRVTRNNTHSGRELGRELRKLRKGARLSQTDVANRLKCGQAKINKIESSIVRVSSADLERLVDLYQVSAGHAEDLRELLRHQPARRSADTPVIWPAHERLTDLELDAQAIFSWHSEGIPVPLASEPYLLARVGNHPGSRECVTELLAQRVARSKILHDESVVDYQPILSESALLRMPGGYCPRLVVDQMEHLVNLVHASSRLTLRILRFDAALDFVDSDFILLRFPPTVDEKDFAYLEYVSGARNITKSSELESFEEHWRRLRGAALNPVDSVAFIESIANKARDDLGDMCESS